MKKGFSLAEVLIALAIVGILSALMVSVAQMNSGNIVKVEYKNAFNMASQAVTDIISNYTAFPNGNLTNYSTTSSGDYGTLTYAFCNTFQNDINIIPGTYTACSTASATSAVSGGASTTYSSLGTPNFITTNGMKWYGFELDFTPATGGSGVKVVWVDVDGKGVNVFPIQISATGHVTPVSGNTTTITYLEN